MFWSGVPRLAAAAMGAAFLISSAQAGLAGSQIGWQSYAAVDPYNPSDAGSQTSGTFTVDGTVGGTFIEPANGSLQSVFNIIADDSSITFDYSVDQAPGPWSAPPITGSTPVSNGLILSLLSGGNFSGVSIDSATNMSGFGASSFSFTGNQITIDWSGLNFSTATVVKLDLATDIGTATPEPCTFMLLLPALAGAAIVAFRK